MVDFYDDCKVIALLDNPSSESFGMIPPIIEREGSQSYEVHSLSRGVVTIPRNKFEELYGGQILKIDSKLPIGLSNPVAMWLGHQFCAKAKALGAPALPEIDETWSCPLEPHKESGHYKIRSCHETFEILDGWVNATGIAALTRNNYDFARLMNWALPFSSATQAALYLTAPTNEDKQRELEWQLKIKQDSGENITISDLVQMHERTRSQLLH